MTQELKPCPFCGSEAEIDRVGNRLQSTIYVCTSCSCSLETGEEWGHGTAWNTRKPDPAVLVEALEHALDAMQSSRTYLLTRRSAWSLQLDAAIEVSRQALAQWKEQP